MKNLFVTLTAIFALLSGLAVAENRLTVYATAAEAAKPAAYILEAAFDSPVSPTSHFEIIFPPEYNLRNVVMAASNKLDGTLKVESQGSTLILSRQDAAATVAAGQVIDLRIAVVLNPAQAVDKPIAVILKQNGTEQRAESRAAAQAFEPNNR